MKILKIILSAIFVLAVCAAVVKSCVPAGRRISESGAPKQAKAPASLPTIVTEPRARMAIILDDWGYDYSMAEKAFAIHRPLTLAVLPHLPQSRRIAQEAHARGLGVMLHMPMEPKNQKTGLEPHTLRVGLPEAEILAYLNEALASVPFVEGVNNHQGSLATSDERLMRTVLTRLKKLNLFFVDSFVISTSVGPRIAREIGIRFTKRDVFIDNIVIVDAIKNRLREGVRKAKKRGSAVVIGHDKAPTLEAIAQMVPEIEAAGVRLVLAKELVQG